MKVHVFLIELPASMFTVLKIKHVQQHNEAKDILPCRENFHD